VASVTVWLVSRLFAAAPGNPPVFGQVDDDRVEFRRLVCTVAVWLFRGQATLAPSDASGFLVDNVGTFLWYMGFAHDFLLIESGVKTQWSRATFHAICDTVGVRGYCLRPELETSWIRRRVDCRYQLHVKHQDSPWGYRPTGCTTVSVSQNGRDYQHAPPPDLH
jgi:hypothetical protein